MRSSKLLLTAALAISSASAQEIVSARAGLIHHMEGTILIDGKEVVQVGDQFVSMKQGQTLATEQGRGEVLLNAGTYLRMGEASSFKLDSADLENTRLTLLSGTVLIEVADLPKDVSATLDILGSHVALRKRGLYEFTAEKPGNVRVYDGEISLTSEGATPIKITKGREIAFNALSSGPGKFDEKLTSSLYNWGSHRAIYIAQVNQSAAQAAYAGGLNSALIPLGSLGTMGMLGYRGMWVFNPLFGMYTYLPMRGYGYSPFGIAILSPQTAYVQTYQPSMNTGFDTGRAAASSSTYSGAAVSSSVGAVSAPAASAPAAATPNTGGGADAGRRR